MALEDPAVPITNRISTAPGFVDQKGRKRNPMLRARDENLV
jgi:hypothetical protein